jgi:L-lactate dehydrogenase (cytochrome)
MDLFPNQQEIRTLTRAQASDSGAPGAGVAKTTANSISPFIDWTILSWLRQLTSLPVVLKGIQSVEDAVLAYQHGVQGIVLSNHGGRSQDTYVEPRGW